MNIKINLFTALIIVYSIVVCSIFKREDGYLDMVNVTAKSSLQSHHANVQSTSQVVAIPVITASTNTAKKELPQ